MPNREDIHRGVTQHVLEAVAATTATQTTSSVDTAGYDSCAFDVSFGATAPALEALTITESDDNSTFTTAPATAVVIDYDTTVALANKTVRSAYVGAKRYAKLVINPTTATDILGVVARLGYASAKPTPNPA